MYLIKKSVELSWKNLILIVPFLIEMALGFFGVLLLIGPIVLFYFNGTNLSDVSTTAIFIGLVFVLFFSYYFIHSFVLSGTFGMIKELLAGNEVKMSQFFAYGKRYVWKAFFFQFLVCVVMVLLLIPNYFFVIGQIEGSSSGNVVGYVLYVLVQMLVSVVLMFVAQFSILSIVRDGSSVKEAIKVSFKIITKGFVDCLVLFGCFLLSCIPLIIVTVVLSLIPAVGSLALAFVQCFLMVILLLWSVLFYDKYK